MLSFMLSFMLIKAKQQHGINQNKNTGFFINCMDFVVVRTKINKKLNRHFFSPFSGLDLYIQKNILQKRNGTIFFLEPKPKTETK
jgi:hypothetical protein